MAQGCVLDHTAYIRRESRTTTKRRIAHLVLWTFCVDEVTMAANIESTQMWTLNQDGESVKLRLPRLPLHGLPEPLEPLVLDVRPRLLEASLAASSLVGRCKGRPPAKPPPG